MLYLRVLEIIPRRALATTSAWVGVRVRGAADGESRAHRLRRPEAAPGARREALPAQGLAAAEREDEGALRRLHAAPPQLRARPLRRQL